MRLRNKACRCVDFVRDRCLYFCLNDHKDRSSQSKSIRNKIKHVILHGRRLVACYGECHMYAYGAYLRKSREFRKHYVLLGGKELPYLARYHAKYLNKKSSWDKLDILIYNGDSPDREGIPTLREVLTWLPEKAKRIEVTNAAFKGYFPQHTNRVFENGGYFAWGDKNLNKCLEEGRIVDEALRELKKPDYYSSEYVNSFFVKSVDQMKMYEKHCTIRIADYIEQHGRERILFYSVTHPEGEIMRELGRRVLLELDVEDNREFGRCDDNTGLFYLHSHGEMVYPSVCAGLGIPQEAYENRRVQTGNYKEITYDFDEYVREYLRFGQLNKKTNSSEGD